MNRGCSASLGLVISQNCATILSSMSLLPVLTVAPGATTTSVMLSVLASATHKLDHWISFPRTGSRVNHISKKITQLVERDPSPSALVYHAWVEGCRNREQE